MRRAGGAFIGCWGRSRKRAILAFASRAESSHLAPWHPVLRAPLALHPHARPRPHRDDAAARRARRDGAARDGHLPAVDARDDARARATATRCSSRSRSTCSAGASRSCSPVRSRTASAVARRSWRGLVVFTLASIAAPLAPDVLAALIAARFVQAHRRWRSSRWCRARSSATCASGEKAAHMLSTMMLVLGGHARGRADPRRASSTSPFGWRANFAVVALYGAVLLAARARCAARDAGRIGCLRALDPGAMVAQLAHRARLAHYVGFTSSSRS